MTRRIVPALLAIAVAVVAVVLVSAGGDDKYTINMHLANAGGLRDGSPVVNGGVPVGIVELHAKRDYVEAQLKIDKKYSPIGKDAVAGIIAQNLIGQKQVRLQIGDRSEAAPDGYMLPGKQVLETTDLDQLLNTFDADTRTRLAILINETGTAFAGRKMDFSTFLRDFAPALNSGGKVLNELTTDNRALTNLVDTSDAFVAELANQRRHFARVLANAGEAAKTGATKRAELRETLRRAPGALQSTRRFLAELRQTTAPLGQTARLLTKTSPSLRNVLDQIGPFERDAGPTIRALAPLGPIAKRTGTHTSRVVTRLVPTTADLEALSKTEVPPVGSTLNGSIDNALAAVDNWAHAIQFRDGLGHIFRGEASISPDIWDSVINRLIPPSERKKLREQDRKKKAAPAAPKTDAPKAPEKPKLKLPEIPLLPKVNKVIDDVLAPVKNLLPTKSDAPKRDSDASGLLDYLLGGGR
jgi:phospholipid/cholesterol/gamma-HCH transport system substrate-binding protein